METQRRQSKEEEPSRAFLKRIQSLGPNFNSKVEKFKDSIKSLTDELSTWKKIENQVLADVAESIRNIDDLIERNDEYSTSQSDPQAPEKNAEDRLLVTAPELRYNDLEPPLRRCLLFLSVFPENAIIHKKSIIYWWIGEGLVKPNKVQTAEQAGERCFKMLLLNGLILPTSKKHDKNPRCCKLHSSVRQMLISEATKAGLCFKIYYNEELTEKDHKDDRFPLSCLRATENKQSVMVSTASLEHKSDEFLLLFNISAHLQILDLGACFNLEALPAGIGLLKNLTHLDMSECSLLDGMPKGLGQLSKLQVLKGFIMSRSMTDESCRLKDLTGLENLRKLSINIAKGAKADGYLKELKTVRFPKLSTLTITWGQVTQTPPVSFPEISLPKLEKLDLQCIPQHEKLNWLKPGIFPDLKKLYSRGGKLTSLNLVTGGEKWKVETLRLKFLTELEWNWSNIMNAFPSLACAEIYECPKLKAEDASLLGDRFWVKEK
ncbi:hypothetical protein MRB53_022973 [Persea americana]|uniref:Uncharacterized protein n=1 Tax=Persea americana TaxID=3435 RepID=A0ACC2L8G4_PERAE|nr:hypothetical protein MRB53_022973 [Persea americana]